MKRRVFKENGNQFKTTDFDIRLYDAAKMFLKHFERNNVQYMSLITDTAYVVPKDIEEAKELASAVVSNLTCKGLITIANPPGIFSCTHDFKNYVEGIVMNPRIEINGRRENLFIIIDGVFSLNYRIWKP